MATKRRKPKKPTPERLGNVALSYLSRYASSEASLRRVLENRVRRYAMKDEAFAADRATWEVLSKAIEDIVEKHKRLGVLNDKAYAEMKVAGLRRSGGSARRIAQKLAQKGVKKEIVEDALVPEEGEIEDAEMKAARAFARKRCLGPFKRGGKTEDRGVRAKEIAAMARAGFSYDVAREILGALPEEAWEE